MARKTPNASERRALKAAEVARFVTLYGRKAQKGQEPNDRKYDGGTERALKALPPEELSRLLNDDEDE